MKNKPRVRCLEDTNLSQKSIFRVADHTICNHDLAQGSAQAIHSLTGPFGDSINCVNNVRLSGTCSKYQATKFVERSQVRTGLNDTLSFQAHSLPFTVHNDPINFFRMKLVIHPGGSTKQYKPRQYFAAKTSVRRGRTSSLNVLACNSFSACRVLLNQLSRLTFKYLGKEILCIKNLTRRVINIVNSINSKTAKTLFRMTDRTEISAPSACIYVPTSYQSVGNNSRRRRIIETNIHGLEIKPRLGANRRINEIWGAVFFNILNKCSIVRGNHSNLQINCDRDIWPGRCFRRGTVYNPTQKTHRDPSMVTFLKLIAEKPVSQGCVSA